MRDPEGFYDTPWEYSCAPVARNRKSTSDAVRKEEPVWKFRGPEADGRDCDEYDVPWDQKDLKLRKGGYGRSVEGWRPMSQVYEPIWKEKVLKEEARKEDSLNASPSTSASSSSDLKSTGSLSSTDAVPGLSIPFPAHEFVPEAKPKSTPITPLMETVFCGAKTPLAPDQKEAERERKIQNQLFDNPQLPVPAVRRSKLKPVNTKKTHVIEIRGNPVVLTAKTPPTVKKEAPQPSCQEEYDVPWEFCSQKKLTRLLEKKTDRVSLDRGALSLNFGCARLNPDGAHLDPDIPLQRQDWYHGNVTRIEAEQRLSQASEGSFLVRLCESNKDEYALSLKSAKGFMHMKIQLDKEGKWVLGYFSHPFDTIPKMIRYYSINKLPIKGAEHMCLLYPLKDQLL